MEKYQTEALTSSTLQDTLQLLGEVSEYLKRLPHVPVTRQLIDRIDAHILSPETHTARRLSMELSAETELRQMTRVAASYTASGLPIIEVAVQGDSVRMKLEQAHLSGPDGEQIAQSLRDMAARQLERGLVLTLAPKTT